MNQNTDSKARLIKTASITALAGNTALSAGNLEDEGYGLSEKNFEAL